jgi:hypothetical protein
MKTGDKLTAQQIHRTLIYLKQTRQLLAREMAYSPDLRKDKLVEFYQGHEAKLVRMVETGTFISA